MRIGLAVPQYGFSLPSGTIRAADAIEWAGRAESVGFDSVWLSDHFFYSFARYGGRVEVGLGAGWFEHEFEAFGYRFGSVGERFDALEDALAITSGLFGGKDPLKHDGRVWSLQGGRLTPPPVQTPIPIWVGGKGGPRLLAAAARWAAGWNTVWRVAPDAY